ncbi:MAG: DUF3047 domain-containing protein [Pseudomonadota bacterium]
MRGPLQKAGTFAAFALQQRRNAARIRGELSPLDPAALRLTGAEPDWVETGVSVEEGVRFRVAVSGHLWLSKPLAVAFNACEAVWIRIGEGRPRKVFAESAVYAAWETGPVRVLAKGLSAFAGEGDGVLAPGPRKALPGGVGVRVTLTEDAPDDEPTPDGWTAHWQIGEGTVYQGGDAGGDGVEIRTHGDVGIIRRPLEAPLREGTRLEWEWRIDALPSELPEDLVTTHDYLSVAVEFENGLDLTYMWSASLPEGHAFRCPLPWWCDREFHLVARSGTEGLGEWRRESRDIWADYPKAIPGPRPERVVAFWVIANSIFQRGRGAGAIRGAAVV